MSMNSDIVEIFDACIDRLHNGENLEAILQDYPHDANQLRAMLEVGNITSKVSYPAGQIDTAYHKIQPTVNQTIIATFGSNGFGLWLSLGLILIMTTALFFALRITSNLQDISTTTIPTSIATTNTRIQLEGNITEITSEQFVLNNLIIDIGNATIVGTLQSEAFVNVAGQVVEGQVIASVVTVITTPEAQATIPDMTPSMLFSDVIVVEGQVTMIQDNILTLYGMDFVLPENSPLLTAIQVGDTIRIEGQTSDVSSAITIVNLTVLNVTIIVNQQGLAWRDDNCNNAPPPWASQQATDWFIRCTSPQGAGSSNGSGSGSS